MISNICSSHTFPSALYIDASHDCPDSSLAPYTQVASKSLREQDLLGADVLNEVEAWRFFSGREHGPAMPPIPFRWAPDAAWSSNVKKAERADLDETLPLGPIFLMTDAVADLPDPRNWGPLHRKHFGHRGRRRQWQDLLASVRREDLCRASRLYGRLFASLPVAKCGATWRWVVGAIASLEGGHVLRADAVLRAKLCPLRNTWLSSDESIFIECHVFSLVAHARGVGEVGLELLEKVLDDVAFWRMLPFPRPLGEPGRLTALLADRRR